MSDDPKKRFLSPQAKQAAIEARRRLAGAQPFGWEIRKFGSFVSAAAKRASGLSCRLKLPVRKL